MSAKTARPHTVRERPKLLKRVHRIRGQLNGVEKLLKADADCAVVLQTLAACRGALNGLMAEVLEDHVRYHVMDVDTHPDSEQGRAAEQLIELLRSYLK